MTPPGTTLSARSGYLGEAPEGCKRKSMRLRKSLIPRFRFGSGGGVASAVVVRAAHIGDVIERHIVISVILEKVIIRVRVICFFCDQEIVISVEIVDQQIVVILFGRGTRGNGSNDLAARAFDIDDLAGVGADDRGLVQIVKALACRRADALRSPVLLGHVRFLVIAAVTPANATRHARDALRSMAKAPLAIGGGGCQRLFGKAAQRVCGLRLRPTNRGLFCAGQDRFSMLLLPGPPPVSVILRRSVRARRLSLRVSRLDGRVTLSLPLHVRESEAMAFLRTQEGWLRKALETAAGPAPVALGDEIPVEGRPVRLVAGAGRMPKLEFDALMVPGDPARAAARVAAFLKTRARDRLAAASDRYARQVGRSYRTLSLRDTRSRWGSCTSAGGLMYNWRLVMAPPKVLDYVAAHEVAHLVEMNHSPAFWAVVDALMPDYQTPRRWLKSEGHALHAYRFEA